MRTILILLTLLISLANPASAQTSNELKRGFAWPIEVGDLDPHNTSSDTIFSLIAHYLAPLVAVNKDNEIVPALAKSWEISADSQTLTLELRQNAYWSDGTPITAQQAKESLERALSPQSKSDAKQLLLPIKGAQQWLNGKTQHPLGIKAINRYQLRIDLAGSPINFLRVLAFPIASPIPVHLMDDSRAYPPITKLSSSGPYQPITLQKHFVRFKSNGAYFSSPPLFTKVSFRFAPFKELMGEYLSQSLDTLEYVSKDQMPWINEKMKAHVSLLEVSGVFYMVMKHQALDGFEPELRKTLMDSVASARINKLLGHSKHSTHRGLIPWKNDRTNLPAPPNVTEALQKARAILERQGYSAENPRPTCILIMDSPENIQLFNFLKAHWQTIHIKLEKKNYYVQDVFKSKDRAELCDIVVSGYATRTQSEEEVLMDFFPGGFLSHFLQHDENAMAMHRNVARLIESKQRLATLDKMERYLLNERYAKTLYPLSTSVLSQPTALSNYTEAKTNYVIPLTYHLKP